MNKPRRGVEVEWGDNERDKTENSLPASKHYDFRRGTPIYAFGPLRRVLIRTVDIRAVHLDIL